jgi:hypothetical protein
MTRSQTAVRLVAAALAAAVIGGCNPTPVKSFAEVVADHVDSAAQDVADHVNERRDEIDQKTVNAACHALEAYQITPDESLVMAIALQTSLPTSNGSSLAELDPQATARLEAAMKAVTTTAQAGDVVDNLGC